MTGGLNESEANLEMILADMAQEFIESCEDRLDDVDVCLGRLQRQEGIAGNDILEVKRHVHSLKGMGATFQFPSVTLIAHALEDYFETLFELSQDGIFDVQLFVDRIREIAENRIDLPRDEALEMLQALPLKARRRSVIKNDKELTLLLHMPQGIQRKIIGKELSQFGFNVVIVDSAIDAIRNGLSLKPDIIMSTMVADDLSGIELAGVFHAVNATRNCPFLLVTAGDVAPRVATDFPENVTILRKGINFARDLMGVMKQHGYVGRQR